VPLARCKNQGGQTAAIGILGAPEGKLGGRLIGGGDYIEAEAVISSSRGTARARLCPAPAASSSCSRACLRSATASSTA